MSGTKPKLQTFERKFYFRGARKSAAGRKSVCFFLFLLIFGYELLIQKSVFFFFFFFFQERIFKVLGVPILL